METRKQNRLKNYDYSQNGYYFVTICTAKKKSLFSTIIGQPDGDADMKLTGIGKIAANQLFDLEKRYDVAIDKYVIMPNHIHLILKIDMTLSGNRPTLSDIIRAYKSLTTKECRKFYKGDIWQSSFYDHVIRNEKDYLRIYEYIENNPLKWADDEYFTL